MENLPSEEEESRERDPVVNGEGAVGENGEEEENGDVEGEEADDRNYEEWARELSKALEDGVDYSSLREICAGHSHEIPPDCRVRIWKICLGVLRKPDAMAMANWDGSLECLDRDAISQHCSTQAQKLEISDEERAAVTGDMKATMTFYCKSRNVRFRSDSGWAELLLPIASLRTSRSDMYSFLYTIVQKYVPRDCRRDGRPFHLFRLLLLYHDPELCSFLDTKRISADMYLQCWLRSLFAATCRLEVTLAMWDKYLLDADPFQVFFLALVILVNSKESLITETTQSSQRELAENITSFPCLLGAEDIDDFCLLAQHYAELTPQSFRMDYHAPLFGHVAPSATQAQLSQVFCLPVGLTELIASLRRRQNATSEPDEVGYFIVDCRPLEQYHAGRLAGAHHLNAQLMLENVKKFESSVSTLMEVHDVEAAEDHWCFISSGQENEDQYMNMAIAKFLKRNIPYISVARGGYTALKTQFGDRVKNLLEADGGREAEIVLPATDNVDGSPGEPAEEMPPLSLGMSRRKGGVLMGRMMEAVREKTANMRTKLAEQVEARRQVVAERHALRNTQQQQQEQQAYRSSAPVFSIGGEDDDDNESARSATSETEVELAARRKTVNIRTFCNKPEVVETFECHEIKPDGMKVPARIILTSKNIYTLRELPDRPGWAQLFSENSLVTLIKITSKRHHPELITLRFGTVEEIESMQRFIIPQAGAACKAMKIAVLKEVDRLS